MVFIARNIDHFASPWRGLKRICIHQSVKQQENFSKTMESNGMTDQMEILATIYVIRK